MKYEPTEGRYAALGANLISRESSNPFGDRIMLFSRLLADWALGNCDNHLKNHSLILEADWSHCLLSPLYDVTCTTVYPQLSLEMGMGLCESRRIDDVTKSSMLDTAKDMGIGKKAAMSEIEATIEQFPKALQRAEHWVASQGFTEAEDIAGHIRTGFERRTAHLGRA